MANETGKGKIEEFAGVTLKTPITYSYKWTSFDSVQAMREAGEWPNEADILKARNAKAEAVAKSSEYQRATKILRELLNRTYEKQQSAAHAAMLTAGMPKEIADNQITQIPKLKRHVEAQRLLDAITGGQEVGEIDFAALDSDNSLA